jgi:hypothetical protein
MIAAKPQPISATVIMVHRMSGDRDGMMIVTEENGGGTGAEVIVGRGDITNQDMKDRGGGAEAVKGTVIVTRDRTGIGTGVSTGGMLEKERARTQRGNADGPGIGVAAVALGLVDHNKNLAFMKRRHRFCLGFPVL